MITTHRSTLGALGEGSYMHVSLGADDPYNPPPWNMGGEVIYIIHTRHITRMPL